MSSSSRATRRAFLYVAVVCFVAALALLTAARLAADTLAGTVKDSSGAVVPGAKIEISGAALKAPVALVSDAAGKFSAPDLAPGTYTVRVTKDGFDAFSSTVEVKGSADVAVNLAIAEQQTTVNVAGARSGLANSNSTYHALRDVGLADTFAAENVTMPMDVGTFQFTHGTFTPLAPVSGFITGVVFVGQGHFSLKPVSTIDINELKRRAQSETVEQDFSEVVFRFSPKMYQAFAGKFGLKTATPPEAAAALDHFRHKVRDRHEIPIGLTQGIFEGETMDNVDADVLAAVMNPQHPQFLNCYIRGAQHHDLRFFIRTRVGALPQLDSSEEVGLVNFNGDELDDGVWYSNHLLTELQAHTANSLEDRRIFSAKKYTMEVVVAKNNHLFTRAVISYSPLLPGERVMKFALLPNLRVVRVTSDDGKDIEFVQEDRKHDGSFYAILDKAFDVGSEHTIAVEYAGDKVLYDAGNGSYYVSARDSWYPNLGGGGFGEKSLYDITYKVAHGNVVIGVGDLKDSGTEEGFAVTHWVTPVPVSVAGFNIGQYIRTEYPDDITHYKIAGYYLSDLPSNIPRSSILQSMAPKSMTQYVLDQTRAQMQICTNFFGKGPYETVNITEQPNMNFGQSWPTLVYLPIMAYFDSTQRWMAFGSINDSLTGFVREVTPHEVAHQWFGHGATPASYHDEWLSEGFAEFAAGLFMQYSQPKWQHDYTEFWERQKKRIMESKNYGASNDAGPIWLGMRLVSPKNEQAYNDVVYAKGAFVMSMLRSLLYDDHPTDAKTNRDQLFMDVMHEYMAEHATHPASTESFRAIVNKHVPKAVDLQGNGRLDWFFAEWVYGTAVPKYEFHYEVAPNTSGSGGFRVHCTLTQSAVDEHFAMFVPVFVDWGEGMRRMGQIPVAGNNSHSVDFVMDKQPKKVAINIYKDILER
jgi:Peptidase family M1 domain/Carboxypeptidase regulatory-like domain